MVSLLGSRLKALSMESGQSSRTATNAQRTQLIHLGARFRTSRRTMTARISQPAEILMLSNFRNRAVISVLLSKAVDHFLNLSNFVCAQCLPGGKSRQKRREGTVKGIFHKFLALHGVIITL